ncbi:MAG: hypothetical protein LBL92_05485 [Propionibacteriaceae bacterium]|jgi:hypothetical protein|nr:hypothetical protein [Propionibacteriaceae bacterium]
MAPVFRDIDVKRDAARIVTFYKRYNFGMAIAMGFPFTEQAFRDSLTLNDVARFRIVEDGNTILGDSGLFFIDSAMAAQPGELRGNHLLFEVSARGGMIVGEMLEGMLAWLIKNNYLMATLRVRPQNKIALFSYLRTGFRAVDHTRPAADGLVDLTTHLPSILGAFKKATDDPRGGIEMPHMGLTVMRSTEIGESQMTDGVEHHADGSVTMSVLAEPKGMTGEATVDARSGRLLNIMRNGEDWTDHILQVVAYPPELPPVVFNQPSQAAGPFTVDLDSDGNLRVTHPDHLGPVLLDCFPDDQGHTVAYRKPPRRSVAIEATANGWVTRDETTGTSRTITINGDTIEVECRLADDEAGPRRLAAHPWVGLRTCNLAITMPGVNTRGDHVHTGLWPPLAPGYEGSLIPDWSLKMAGAQQLWSDPVGGWAVTISWADEGRLRADGEARATGPVLRYTIQLVRSEPQPVEATAAAQDLAANRAAASSTASPTATWTAATWGTDLHRLTTPDNQSEITVSPVNGLLTWDVRGQRHLVDATSPKPFSCLSTIPATLWPSIDTDRTDVLRGPEWAESDPRIIFSSPAAPVDDPDRAKWSLEANADLTELELTTSVPDQFAGQEVSLNFKVPTAVTEVEFEDSTGQWSKLSYVDRNVKRIQSIWWAYSRRLRCRLDKKTQLSFEPIAGPNTEILIRGTNEGFMFVLQSRVEAGGSTARWRMRLDV